MVDWNPKANELFLQAAELEESRRESFLSEQCKNDAELRRQVDSLLTAKANAGSFLEPGKAALPETTAPLSDQAGVRLGPYKLLQKIGEGGMGSVWIADQEVPVKRRVALKLIKPGMESAAILRRFEAERQALAMMDHSSIAKVLDAGAMPDGRPYFVMELIKGVPITRYCDELHLSLRERLALLVPVCQAIQHAHQKGIIHRDIKPSNILVAIQDGQPSPKIIDFGVAKALHQPLTDATLMTEFGAVIGTLEYMSPEQAELSALDVDTRTDVYALGVLLYELLTGSTPLDKKRLKNAAFAELLRLIKEVEPPKPSTRLTQSREQLASLAAQRKTEPARLQKDVSGELDWIVMKCLEKDRTRRYESASALSQDIQHYLANEPVQACPPSAGYRLRKWAWRNRVAVIFALTVWFITLTQAGFSTLQWLNARNSEDRAIKERDLATEARQGEEKKAGELAVALRRSEARRLATTALLKATSEPDLAGPLARQAVAMENDAEVASTVLSALKELPRLHTLQVPGDNGVFPSYTPTWWYQLLPDGKHLLLPSAGGERMVIYDSETGKMVRTFLTPSDSAKKDEEKPDPADALRLEPRTYSKTFSGPSPLSSNHRDILVSTDGSRLFMISELRIRVWDITTGKHLIDLKPNPNFAVVSDSVNVSIDGRTVIALVEQRKHHQDKPPDVETQLFLWNAAGGQGRSLHTFAGTGQYSLALSRDSKWLAVCSRWDHRQTWFFDLTHSKLLWNKHTGDEWVSFPNMTFSPDGTRLVEVLGKRLVYRHAATGEIVKEDSLAEDYREGATLQCSADGRWVLASPNREIATFHTRGVPMTRGSLYVIDTVGMRQIKLFRPETLYFSMCRLSPDGKRAFSLAHDNSLWIWEIPSGELVHYIKVPGQRIDFYQVAQDGSSAWIQRTSNQIQRLECNSYGVMPHGVFATQTRLLSSDAQRIYCLTGDKSIALETLDAAKLTSVEHRALTPPDLKDRGPVKMYLLSEGRRALCTFYNGSAILVDTEANPCKVIKDDLLLPYARNDFPERLLLPRCGGRYYVTALSKAGGAPNLNDLPSLAKVMDAATGTVHMDITPEHDIGGFRAGAFSSDGKWLAVAPGYLGGEKAPPREIQLWNLTDKKLEERITYDSDFIPQALALRSDGAQLLAWDTSAKLFLWEKGKGWRKPLPKAIQIRQATLSADGRLLATVTEGAVTLWDLNTSQTLYTIPIDPLTLWEIQFTANDTMLLTTNGGEFRLWPTDLRSYLEKQRLPALTEQQRRDLGIGQ